MTSFIRAALLGAVMLLATDQIASAQVGGFCGNGFGGYGYSPMRPETVPYYALYPPVYYSQIVPRSYGYSSFAYPAGVMTPEVANPEPKQIINPFVPGKPQPEVKTKPTSDKTTQVEPQRIDNPYFGVDAATDTRLTSRSATAR